MIDQIISSAYPYTLCIHHNGPKLKNVIIIIITVFWILILGNIFTKKTQFVLTLYGVGVPMKLSSYDYANNND